MAAVAASPRVQEPGDHRRDEERVRGTGAHRADQRGGVGLTGHECRCTGTDSKQRVADAAHVEQRHGHQVGVALVEGKRRGQVRRVVDQRALTEQHALGTPGGARAVDHQRGLVLFDARVGPRGCRRGQQRFVLVADLDDAFNARHPLGGRFGGRSQLGADEQHARAAVGQDVDEFVTHHPPVDDGGDDADGGAGDQDFETGGVILVQEGHALRPARDRRRAAPRPCDESASSTRPRTTGVRRSGWRSRRAAAVRGVRRCRRASRPCRSSCRLVA